RRSWRPPRHSRACPGARRDQSPAPRNGRVATSVGKRQDREGYRSRPGSGGMQRADAASGTVAANQEALMSAEHTIDVEQGVAHPVIRTPRLTLRPWSLDDADAALAVYGEADVARWLSPAMDRVSGVDAMRELLQRWVDEPHDSPEGRWAVELRGTDELVGG